MRRSQPHTYRYDNEADLHLMDLAGGTSRRLTDAARNSYEAAFAGNGAVVFSSKRLGGHHRIYRTSLSEPGETELLAVTGADAWGPRYSQATGEVVFYTGKPGAWRMMLVPLSGGPVRPYLDDGTSKSGADWCPG